MLKFNINESVKVKLTERGKELLKEDHENFWSSTSFPKITKPVYIPPKVDKDGFSEFQFWHFMHTFGPYLYLGSVGVPFEELNIYFNEKDLKKCKK